MIMFSICRDYLEPPFGEEATQPNIIHQAESILKVEIIKKILKEFKETAKVQLAEMKLKSNLPVAQLVQQPDEIEVYSPEILETAAVYKEKNRY